ncbi:MAG TPA: DUF2726 domain-containing protein [Albitalea sp.]|nr:DUF2726 domain-containing protein [Albitalea sp.]
MSSLVIAVVFLLALALVWWGVRSRAARRSDPHPGDNLDTVAGWPPQATRVLTSAERQAYDLVRSALPAHMVLAQVPLQRFLKVPTRNSYAEWLRRVGQLSVDLLVCDRHSQVIAAIEVQAGDEPPSGRALRRRDRLLKVLKAAEIPTHVWSGSKLPTVEAVREAIAPAPAPAEAVPPANPAAARSLPGRLVNSGAHTFAQIVREPPPDDTTELREPPPSTWFDDFDSAPAPLAGEPAKESKDRPAR